MYYTNDFQKGMSQKCKSWNVILLEVDIRNYRVTSSTVSRLWPTMGPSYIQFSTVQSLSCVRLYETPPTATFRLPCPSPTHRVHPNSCPSSWWCHLTISSSVIPFSSHPRSFPTSGSFPMSQFFTSGGQSIGVSASASVLPMNIQDWFPLGWTA